MIEKKYYKKAVLIGLLVLGACSHATTPSQNWTDDTYISLMETGSDMVDENRIQAAIPFYQQSLTRAFQAGDTESITISSYNLALSQLRNGDAPSALKTVKKAQLSLQQHGIEKISVHLALIKGVILNAQNKWEESQKALEPCFLAKNIEIKTHAFYIKGLNDFSLKNSEALQKDIHDISVISEKNNVENENEDELKIREQILQGNYNNAEKAAEILVSKRRLHHEYAPMRDALSLEAEALERAGNSKKAQNFRLQVIESKKASVL
ncbi:hypothetical protein FAI41_00125 [Acetobacteraceae bacterium]|nr:hypothetical protein FAI41_00125 [Acetobacteraceae bacterium]